MIGDNSLQALGLYFIVYYGVATLLAYIHNLSFQSPPILGVSWGKFAIEKERIVSEKAKRMML